MKGFWKYVFIEIKLFLREPIGSFFTLVFPLLLLFTFGSIFGNKPNEFYGGRGYIDLMVPAFTGLIIATSGLMSVTIDITTYREMGILKRFNASSFPPIYVLGASFIVIFMATTLGMILLIIAGVVVYKIQFTGTVFGVIFGFLLSCMSFFSIGFVLASLIKTNRTAQVVANIIYFPMIFLSGATIPSIFFPQTFKTISNLIPLTHTVNILQGFWYQKSWSALTTEMIVLISIFVVCTIVSVKIFKWE